MLSILIPERDYDCRKLVNDLVYQCSEAAITYEVIVLDDFSSLYLDENRQISQLPGCTFVELHQNYGAARTRNNLAGMAKYPFLLMIDCDAAVPDAYFIQRYLDHIGTADVIVGGLSYSNTVPENDKMLRWKYGIQRECIDARIRNRHPYQSMLSFQFLIRKDVMLKHPFEETVKDYGHEDTILGYAFRKHKISILYIDNPLIHLGLDSSPVFLQKSLMAARKYLNNPIFKNQEIADSVKLFRVLRKAEKYKLQQLIIWIFISFRTTMQKNLCGNKPSLFIFDCYRLGYLCLLHKIESRA